jgi:uncharacterized membrane protein
MHPAGAAHLVLATAALALGAAVLGSTKGTQRHRLLGVLYVFSMFGLNLTALTIYGVFGGFGVFHALALASLATLAAGFGFAFMKRPRSRWVGHHYYFMAWSYVGLCAAAAAEVGSRLPGVSFASGVAIPSIIIIALGGLLIHVRRDATLAKLHRPDPTRRVAARSGELP